MNNNPRRTSVYLTQEGYRQLEDLSAKLGENKSKVIARAIQLLHYSSRFPNIDPREFLTKENDDAGTH
jgi:hypothetical protein